LFIHLKGGQSANLCQDIITNNEHYDVIVYRCHLCMLCE